MLQTRFTSLFQVERPIVQGGLQHLAFGRLAAAVSNAGGLGQISAAAFPTPNKLKAEIKLAQELTQKPFAVNFALGRTPMNDLLDAALQAGVRCVSFTAGNPEEMINQIRHSGVENEVKIMVLVAGIRAALKAEALGAHSVIAVGFEGGGHLGRDDIGTVVLVPRIVDAVKIPVLASGGIGDARGLAAAFALGAEGIEMGTRFVATQECIAHPRYKQALLAARETDTAIIERSIGRPGRTLKGRASSEILALEATNASIETLLPLISGEINKKAAVHGELEEGFVWAGQVVGLIEDIPSVEELLNRMVKGAEEIISGLAKKMILKVPEHRLNSVPLEGN